MPTTPDSSAHTPAAGEAAHTPTVNVPARTAFLIRQVFLPRNPNKLRGATPEVIQAAKDFISIVEGGS